MEMMDYKEIVEGIRNNANKIRRLEEINREIYRDREKQEEYAQNGERISKLYLVNKILTDNARQSAFAHLLPIFTEIIAKYHGKQYGTKTKEKLAEEMKERTGFRVYLHADRYSQEIHFFGSDFFGYQNTKLEIYLMNHDEIIGDSNRIAEFEPQNAKLSYCSEYVDDVEERVRAINDARRTAKTLYEQTEQAINELNKLLPSSADNVYIQKHYPWVL